MLRTARTFPRTNAALSFYIALSSIPRIVVSVEKCLKGISRCEVGDEMAQHSDVDEKRPRRRRKRRRESKREKMGAWKGAKSVKVGREWKRISTETEGDLARVFLASMEERGRQRSFRSPCFRRFVTEYTSAREKEKIHEKEGVPRATASTVEMREGEASSDKAVKRTCKYMREPK